MILLIAGFFGVANALLGIIGFGARHGEIISIEDAKILADPLLFHNQFRNSENGFRGIIKWFIFYCRNHWITLLLAGIIIMGLTMLCFIEYGKENKGSHTALESIVVFLAPILGAVVLAPILGKVFLHTSSLYKDIIDGISNDMEPNVCRQGISIVICSTLLSYLSMKAWRSLSAEFLQSGSIIHYILLPVFAFLSVIITIWTFCLPGLFTALLVFLGVAAIIGMVYNIFLDIISLGGSHSSSKKADSTEDLYGVYWEQLRFHTLDREDYLSSLSDSELNDLRFYVSNHPDEMGSIDDLDIMREEMKRRS